MIDVKKIFLFWGIFLSACTTQIAEDFSTEVKIDPQVSAAFEEVSCPAVPEREFDESVYQGPMIDTHIHISHIPEGSFDRLFADENSSPLMGVNVKMTDYICMMNYEGTSKVFAFFPVWEPIVDESIQLVEQVMKKYPDRFVPFIMPPDHDDRPDGFPTVEAKALEEMLAVSPGLFKGFGEIGLYARGDHGGPKGAPELPPDSERLREIYPVVREENLIVYFHLGEGQKEAFEKILDENPEINFIWHGDQLIKGSGDGQDLSMVEEILSNHSNVYYGVDELYGDTFLIRPEVSKEEFLAHFENSEKLLRQDWDTWKAFIEKHQDQVLWVTDRGWSLPWSLDPEVALILNDYTRAFIGGLSPEVQEKFAYGNAERLAGE